MPLLLRAFRASPLVSAVAVLSLALGIGANTAIFSILDSLLLRTLPVRDPERLAIVSAGNEMSSWTNPIWEQLRARASLFDGACAYSDARYNLAASGETDFVDGIMASGAFFDLLGVEAVLGRTFTEADDRRGGGPDGPVVVISYGFWQRRYGGAADAIGRTLTLDRVPFTVIGVAPPGFFGADVGRTFDVIVPIGVEPLLSGSDSALDQRSYWWLTIMVRLRPGQSLDAGTAAMRGVQPQVREATLPDNWGPSISSYLDSPFTLVPAATGVSYLRERYQRPLVVIMVVVFLVLLVACANIANLLLARAAARRHELSVRLALGASRLRLAWLLLSESLTLAVAGAALGLLFAAWFSRLLLAQLSTASRPLFLDLSLDWRVLGFTTGVALLTAIVFGLAPALRAARVDPAEALAAESRTIAGESRFSAASLLVVAQVALSLALVVAAGLFVRTFASLTNRDLGFERDRVLVVSVNALRSRAEPKARLALYERMAERVAALPGVAGAGLSVVTPVSGSTWMFSVDVPGSRPLGPRERGVHVNLVSPGWLKTMGTGMVAGRDLDARDRPGAPRVGLVNQAFIRHFFGDVNTPVIGRVVNQPRAVPPTPPIEIVGVVRDAVYRSMRDPVPPTLYLALAQRDEFPSSISLCVRAAGASPPARLAKSVGAAVMDVDPDLALTFRTLSDQVGGALVQERLVATLAGFFGALALLLAGIGLYGVTAYGVNRRRVEIGIRVALGAGPARVVRLVVGRVALLVATGLAAGMVAAAWASRFVASLLFGLEPRDPVTLAAAAAVLAGVAALAAWLPARHAARIDPSVTLRLG